MGLFSKKFREDNRTNEEKLEYTLLKLSETGTKCGIVINPRNVIPAQNTNSEEALDKLLKKIGENLTGVDLVVRQIARQIYMGKQNSPEATKLWQEVYNLFSDTASCIKAVPTFSELKTYNALKAIQELSEELKNNFGVTTGRGL